MEKKINNLPLEGIVVLDLTNVLSGPYATMILRDLGAKIIKVEKPGGDDSRGFGPFVDEQSCYFISLNRGKKSILLDLKSKKDKKIFEKLLIKSDILIDNFKPGTLEKIGYNWEYLSKKFPKLIHGKISGFGETGPLNDQPAYDIIVQAMGGLMSLTGQNSDNLVRVGTSIGDIASSLFCVIGILSQLIFRNNTNLGSKLDLSMLDCQIAILENAITRFSIDNVNPTPLGTDHPSISPFGAFKTKDDKIVIAIGNEKLFKKFCFLIDDSEMLIDEIHTLVGAGKTDGAMDASNLLKPALARGELHCIGATTLNEYRENIEKDAALARRFQQVLIEEPSTEDSISILRGLKEKYEVHHGVKILDSAIISAVELSTRYINDRFLPDKAIDLMDEAASRIRLQIDSKPEKLDKIERKILQNKIEYESLKKENDKKSTDRANNLEREIKNLEKEFDEFNKNWKKEKDKILDIQKLKSTIDYNKNILSILQREGKLSEAGELAYSKIPNLENQLKLLESKKEQKILSKSVTSDEIAEVISKSTGIPVERMLEGEKQKIINMETELKKKVIGHIYLRSFLS